MMNKELLQELVNYPEIEGLAKILAEGIAAVIFPEYSMIFFDRSFLEEGAAYNHVECISSITLTSVYCLYDIRADSDRWCTPEEAMVAARIGLKRKDGQEIQWH